jgi:glycosyltransferase involved in cell wall biosynthesis
MVEKIPKVSVIINCLNGEKYLRKAIDSVYAQTYPYWEIIFWDNASTDRSGEVARTYDERLRYFRGKETVPLGAARNLAIQQATGEFFAFLDSDDLWMREKLEKQMPLFEDPEVGLVFSDSILFNNEGDKQLLYSGRRYYTGNCFSKLLTDYFLDIETVIIRRSALNEQKIWFEPSFNLSEEADLFTRIAYKWKLAMVNEPLAKWRVHADSWTWKKNYLAAEERSAALLKYHEIFPDFANRFSKEIGIFEAQTAISKAKNLWKAGKSQAARRSLTSYIFRNKKAFILFFITF